LGATGVAAWANNAAEFGLVELGELDVAACLPVDAQAAIKAASAIPLAAASTVRLVARARLRAGGLLWAEIADCIWVILSRFVVDSLDETKEVRKRTAVRRPPFLAPACH
jgi:hypothetical protein